MSFSERLGLCFSVPSVQCPGGGSLPTIVSLNCYSSVGPGNTRFSWPSESSDQGVSPGWQLQKPGHQMQILGPQMCVNTPLWEIVALWSAAEGESEDGACCLEAKACTR